MAEIEMQDPLSTEIKSSTVAGIIEALNRISSGLKMSSESLTKESMTPVLGLDPEDPRRIYQVSDGKRIWISSPEPKIYVNNSQITSSDKNFTIDFIGGSITFEGEYRPEENDVVTVSCDHIYAAPKASGGCEIIITFSAGFAGRAYSVTSKKGEVYTGNVPSSLVETVRVKYTSTEYTISSSDTAGKQHSTTVTTGEYYGQVEATLNTFSATIVVNTEPTASVTVTGSGATYYATANESGKASVIVAEDGSHSVTSTYKDAGSNTVTVDATSDGETYTATVTFITLVVTVDSGSTVKVQNGATTLTETSNGTAKFWLPNTGTWSITASLDGQTSSTSVECSNYKEYTEEITYIPDTLNECTWEQISKLSSSGKISSYFEVGDTKSIVINGSAAATSFSNLSIDALIIGINHNSSLEGNNLTHFLIGKISGKLVALSDRYYGNSTSSQAFNMNRSSTNSGGWKSSNMRNNILGNSYTPNSPGSSTLLSCLPSDLRAVMKSATKYTDNVANQSNYSSNVTATSDYLFLLSEFEIHNTRDRANQYEQNYQKQYGYFSSGNSKIAYKSDSISSTAEYWCRSPYYGTNIQFCSVYWDGSANILPAGYSYGILPCFVV